MKVKANERKANTTFGKSPIWQACKCCGETADFHVVACGNIVGICEKCYKADKNDVSALVGSKLSKCYKETTYKATTTAQGKEKALYLIASGFHRVSANRFESPRYTSLSALSKILNECEFKFGKTNTKVILESKPLNRKAEISIKGADVQAVKEYRDKIFLAQYPPPLFKK